MFLSSIGRHKTIALAIVASLVIVGGTYISSRPLKGAALREAEISYLGEIQPVISNVASASQAVRTVLASAPSMTRLQLITTLTNLANSMDNAKSQVDTAAIVGRTSLRTSSLTSALSQWDQATHQLESAISQALDGMGNSSAASQLVGTGSTYYQGNSAYESFLASIPAPLSKRFRLPTPNWGDPNGAWGALGVSELVSAIESSGSLAISHQVELVTVNTNPQPVVGPSNSLPVLAGSTTITVSAVVKNTGNVEESNVSVGIQLKDSTGNTQQSTVTTAVSPGRESDVDFPALNLNYSTSTTLTVTVTPVAGQVSSANTEDTLTFSVPAPPPPNVLG